MADHVADEVLEKFARWQHDWFERVRKGSLDPEKVMRAVQKIIDQRENNEFLSLLSSGENLILDACDGKITIAQARNIFSWVDPDFKNWGLDQPGSTTKETPVAVYEMKNTNFSQIFGLIGRDLNNLYLEQGQILNFVQKYRNWLCKDGYATFFLFKVNNNFFVADVYVSSDGELGVYVYRFERSGVWVAASWYRLVVPKLAT